MLHILSITGPVYLIIAMGFAAVRWGLFSHADLRVLGRFVLGFCLPSLLFRALSQRTPGEVLNGVFLLAYTLASLGVLFGAVVCTRRLRGKPLPLAALHGLGMSVSNSGFIGYPIALQLLGPPAVIPLALAIADSGGGSGLRWHQAVARTAGGLLRNPMIVAIVAGFVFALLGWQVPEPLARTVQIVAGAASPIGLFVIGGSLVGLRLAGLRRDIAIVVAGKLLLLPLAVWVLLLLLPPIDPALRTAAVVFACMPMLSIYPLLAQKHDHQAFAAATLLAATLASFATISAWLWLLHVVPGAAG